eukprot:176626_1
MVSCDGCICDSFHCQTCSIIMQLRKCHDRKLMFHLFDDQDFHCKTSSYKSKMHNGKPNLGKIFHLFAANTYRSTKMIMQSIYIVLEYVATDAVTELNISFVRGSICGANVDFFLRLAARICIYLKQILKMTYTCLK